MTDIAETTLGPVQGKVKNDTLLFCGIPYAAPPVGDLRFKAPANHAGWSEVRAATRFSPAAPQLPGGGMTNAVPVRWDEDCLYLNITTPALDNKKRPVLFWIHGGAYRTGQGAVPWYDGANFAKNGDVVVVSINYRLGALGFADLSRFGAQFGSSGANGTLDQITALKWVVDNIENFGGDPKQITISGESAGAFSVGTLLGSPLATGLFQRAIPQSGAAHHVLTKEAAEAVTDLFLETLGVDSMEALQVFTPDEILKAQGEVDVLVANGKAGASLGTVSPFYPAIGNLVLPESPFDAIAAGMSKDIPVLLGTNKDESTMFLTGKYDLDRVKKTVERFGGGDELMSAYLAAYPDAEPRTLASYVQTDHTFRMPAVRFAEARAETGAKTWMYLFAWESRNSMLKSTHALEIPFMFNNLNKPGVDVFLGKGDSPQALADEMHADWIRFIQTGDPGWPKYELNTRVNRRYDIPSEDVSDPDAGKREAWTGIR